MIFGHTYFYVFHPRESGIKSNSMTKIKLQHDVLTQLLCLVNEAGISTEQLLNKTRIDEMPVTVEAEFSETHFIALLETAAKLIDDPHLGLRLGQKVGIESYGTFGFALMSCANLRESIQLLLRYGKAFFQPHWHSENRDGGLVLWPILTKGTPVQQRLITELAFSQWTFIGNSLYRGRIEGAEIEFIFPEPSNPGIYHSTFEAKITFGAERNHAFLPKHILDTPVKTANVSEHVVFHQQCEEMLRGLNSGEKITTEVRRLLLQSAGDFLNISGVAARLNMSERTLRRRLDDESVSFRSLFEEVRDLLAKEYLTKTVLTIAEIAHLLDYSETVNFRRAFVRWNGVTPKKYRQQQARQIGI